MRRRVCTAALLAHLLAGASALAATEATPTVPAKPAPALEAEEAPVFTPAAPKPAAPLSLFQWSLKTEGSLLLVPVEGHLYPAKRSGVGVIETRPPKLAVELYLDGRELSLPLTEIRAPQEALEGWVLEVREGERWRPLAAMHFHETAFYGLTPGGAFEAMPLETIRLSPR